MNTYRKCKDALLGGPDLLGAAVMLMCVPVGAFCWSVLIWGVVEWVK